MNPQSLNQNLSILQSKVRTNKSLDFSSGFVVTLVSTFYIKEEISMKELKMELKSLAKALKALVRQTEKMEKKLDKLEKASRPKKTKKKAPAKAMKKKVVKRTTKVTATDTVLKMIQRRKRGITTAEIKARTGFKEKKIWDIVNRSKREGKIKVLRKGVYAKV